MGLPCFVPIRTKIKKKAVSTFRKGKIVEISWNPTWEPEELQTRVKASSRASKSLKSKSPRQTYLSLHQMNT
jgi:hypothetical protein